MDGQTTNNSNHALLIAENVLKPKLEIDAPNRAWVNDPTYIATAEVWLYFTGHKDLFTEEIVGYATEGEKIKSLVHHSTQGSRSGVHLRGFAYQLIVCGRATPSAGGQDYRQVRLGQTHYKADSFDRTSFPKTGYFYIDE
ncbi:MAG: hypothetical protein ACN4GW_08325 [Desulforhopalus sp.]